MKRITHLVLLAIGIPVMSTAQIRIDPNLAQAVLDAAGAATLTNAQVVTYSRQAIQEMDAKNPVAGPNDPYTQLRPR
jgi:metalloprotease